MATRTTITLVDDIDGGPADETIVFALDGTTYEIDLSRENATDLRDQLAPWLAKARRVTAPGKPARRKPQDRTRRDERAERIALGANSTLRAWAREHGWPSLPDRGRIPDEVRAAWEAARAAGGAE